jgi:uncharacterized protein (DUF1499 family)
MRLLRRILIGVPLLIVAGTVAMMVWARNAPRPATLGLRDGQLAPCPPTPNCVATQGALPEQLMEPLPYQGTREEARQRLLAVVQALPRTTIIEDRPDYLHVEFRTPTIGFIDDVEFAFDDATQQIRFRSASRLGRGDLGVNRARMEEIQRRY